MPQQCVVMWSRNPSLRFSPFSSKTNMTRSFPIVVTLMVPNAEYVLLKVPSFGRSAAIDAARVSTDLRCDGAEYPLAQPPTGHVLRAIPRAPQQPLPGRLGTMPALERQS